MDAARLLREARRRAGLTQRELAHRSGVAQSAIARIEGGAVVPRVDTLDRFLGACGEGLYVARRLGIGVDRSLFEEARRLPPRARLDRTQSAVYELADLRAAVRRARGLVAEPLPAYGPSIIEMLVGHDVRFVVIGGVAANLHGASVNTVDIDICYARDEANLERLAAALQEIHAYLRGAPEGLPFLADARALRHGMNFTFTTDVGDLDCLGEPAGVGGYEALVVNAELVPWGVHAVQIAAVADLIRMKKAAGRPKDLLAIEILAALQDTIDDEPDG